VFPTGKLPRGTEKEVRTPGFQIPPGRNTKWSVVNNAEKFPPKPGIATRAVETPLTNE